MMTEKEMAEKLADLVERGLMEVDDDGFWSLTESGQEYAIEKLEDIE